MGSRAVAADRRYGIQIVAIESPGCHLGIHQMAAQALARFVPAHGVHVLGKGEQRSMADPYRDVFLAKAEERLAGAISEYVNGRAFVAAIRTQASDGS